MQERVTRQSRVPLVCFAFVLAVAFTDLTDGRYLPTRADESEVAALKELIINILNEASQHERERHQSLARSTRFFSTQNNRAKQFARQRYSMSSRQNDEDQTNRMLLDAAFLQRRSAEPTSPVDLVDLDGSDRMYGLAISPALPSASENRQLHKV